MNGKEEWYPYVCTRCKRRMLLDIDLPEDIPCQICGKGTFKRDYTKVPPQAHVQPQAQGPTCVAGPCTPAPETPPTKGNGRKKRFRTLSKPKKEYPPGTLMGACRYCGEEYPKKGGLTAHETGHKNRGDKPLLKPVEGKPAVGIIEEPRQRVKKDEREVREHNEQYQRL